MDSASSAPLIAMMRSPRLISRASPAHCRFQASTAPPGLMPSTRRHWELASPITSRPKGTPSARLSARVKAGAEDADATAAAEGGAGGASDPCTGGDADATGCAERAGGTTCVLGSAAGGIALRSEPVSPQEAAAAATGNPGKRKSGCGVAGKGADCSSSTSGAPPRWGEAAGVWKPSPASASLRLPAPAAGVGVSGTTSSGVECAT